MQKTSLYNKLHAVVSHLRSSHTNHAVEYSEFLRKARLEAFEVPSKNKTKQYCEPSTIRKTISLATKLGLIDAETFQLTSEGTNAARSATTFKNILAAQLLEYLDSKRFSITRILESIDSITPPKLPDAPTIFDDGKTEHTTIDEPEFRKILYLLHLCDRLDREVRHLYFRK